MITGDKEPVDNIQSSLFCSLNARRLKSENKSTLFLLHCIDLSVFMFRQCNIEIFTILE